MKKEITITGRMSSSKPEPMEIDIDSFIADCMKDLPTPVITHDKEQMFVGVDYGSLEQAVMVHYSQTPEGKLVLEKLIIASREVAIDTMGMVDVKSYQLPDMDLDRIYKVYGRYGDHPYYGNIDDGQHDKNGNYRFDYGRNEHPRSPRKRR